MTVYAAYTESQHIEFYISIKLEDISLRKDAWMQQNVITVLYYNNFKLILT